MADVAGNRRLSLPDFNLDEVREWQETSAAFRQAARECFGDNGGKLYFPKEWDMLERQEFYRSVKTWCDTHHVHCFFECMQDGLNHPVKMSKGSIYCLTVNMADDTGASNPAWMRKIRFLSQIKQQGGRTALRIITGEPYDPRLYPISIACNVTDILIIEPDGRFLTEGGEKADAKRMAAGIAAALCKGSVMNHNRIPERIRLWGWENVLDDTGRMDIPVWNHTYHISFSTDI